MRRQLAKVIASGSDPTVDEGEKWITTNSGFRLRVWAEEGTCCKPEITECSENDVENGEQPCGHCQYEGYESCGYQGPFTHVMVTNPSERPEPWDKWQQYIRFRMPDAWKRMPFDYVPVAMVIALIEEHGGERSDSTF